jgi:hypothetical protein
MKKDTQYIIINLIAIIFIINAFLNSETSSYWFKFMLVCGIISWIMVVHDIKKIIKSFFKS